MTIDDLARRMVKLGFDETATKQEVQRGFKIVADELDLIHQDIREIKIVLLDKLIYMIGEMSVDIRSLIRRR